MKRLNVLSVLLGVAALVAGQPAAAEQRRPREQAPARRGRQPHLHDGFYLRGELGFATLGHLTSNSSISNGFAQRIESSARGATGSALSFRLGGTPAPGLVVGGAYSWLLVAGPDVTTLGREFRLDDLQLSLHAFTAFLSYYPEPSDGWHLDLELGGSELGVATAGRALFREGTRLPESQTLVGPVLLLGGGWETWVARQWSVGLNLRALYMLGFHNETRASTLAGWAGVAVTLH